MRRLPVSLNVVLITCLISVVLTAQEPVDRAMVARIRAEATERSKVVETFNYITNVTGARLTGSRAHKQAAEYMRDRLCSARNVDELFKLSFRSTRSSTTGV